MNRRRRRRTLEPKRPKSMIARVTAVIGIVTLVLFGLMLFFIGYENMEATKWMGSIGVIAMVASAISFSLGVKVFRDKSFDTVNRWTGMLLPVVGMTAWMVIYFAGILKG